MSAGSCFIMAKKRAAGGLLPDWYVYLRFPGRKPTTFCSGYAICQKCLEAQRPTVDRATCPCQRKARKLGQQRLVQLNDARWEGVVAGTLPLARRQCATLGEVAEAYLRFYEGLDAGKLRHARRAVGDLRLVVATALDLWTTEVLRGVKAGNAVADVRRIHALPVTCLNKQLVREFFRVRQGGVFDPVTRRPEHLAINKTLNHARTVFSRNSRAFALEGLRIPWESLEDFLGHPALKQPAAVVKLVESAAWDAMVQAADALWEAERPAKSRGYWVAMSNRILRRTALRSVELVAARADWLIDLAGRTWIDLRDRPGFQIKGGTTPGLIPLAQDLAAEIRGNGGYLIGPEDREAIIREDHNKFCKGFLGGLGTRQQGNHRLRDFVAQYLYTLYGETVAKEALRHADARTTMASYARYRSDVPATAARELEAWRPNVVAMRA